MTSNQEVLSIIFRKYPDLKYEVNAEGIVTVYEKQDHLIQRIFRKIRFKIPQYKAITFDEYSSEVFKTIDGVKTIQEIGEILQSKYGDKVAPLYERLLVFLNHLNINCNYIERIK